jgi:ribosome-associated protein
LKRNWVLKKPAKKTTTKTTKKPTKAVKPTKKKAKTAAAAKSVKKTVKKTAKKVTKKAVVKKAAQKVAKKSIAKKAVARKSVVKELPVKTPVKILVKKTAKKVAARNAIVRSAIKPATKPRKIAAKVAKQPAAPKALPVHVARDPLVQAVLKQLDDSKAEQIVSIDLVNKSTMADAMIVASGRSNRHVNAIAEQVAEKMRSLGEKGLRIEGMPQCDWVLVDSGNLIVHIFRPEVRSFYNLEKLWSASAPREDSAPRGESKS